MTQVVRYGEDPLQTLKAFNYNPQNQKTLIFIHGGAWRDPNNTYDDFGELIDQLPRNANYFSLNYRLSPKSKHPDHLQDVINALKFLETHYNLKRVLLVGHSVGATLILQMLTYKALLSENMISPLRIQLENLYFLDGIYDIVELLAEYPTYLLFVNEAFDSETGYANATAVSRPAMNFDFDFGHILLLHSLDDELLSERQLDLFAHYLKQKGVDFEDRRGHWGKHEEVYRRKEIAEVLKDSIPLI